MANYYMEISKLMDKLLEKALIYNINGFKIGPKKEVFTTLEVVILKRIAISPNQKMMQIIDDININRSLASSMIKKLIVKGYIEKNQSKEDRRVYLLQLTENGNQVVEESFNLQKRYLDFVLNDISVNEEKAVLKFLSKLNQLDKK